MARMLSTIQETIISRLQGVPWQALDPIRTDIALAIEETLKGTQAERVLDRWLRDRRGLSADGRRVAAEAVFGVALWRRRLFHHAGEEAGPEALLSAFLE